jgi:hypothetical protein
MLTTPSDKTFPPAQDRWSDQPEYRHGGEVRERLLPRFGIQEVPPAGVDHARRDRVDAQRRQFDGEDDNRGTVSCKVTS